MRRRRADALVVALIAITLLVGGALTLQAYQRQQAIDRMGSMMGGQMDAVHGVGPLWLGLGTALLAIVIGGLYLAVRDGADVDREDRGPKAGGDRSDVVDDERTGVASGATPADGASLTAGGRVLELLPEDERRILEPVIASPGITQIALRDRSDFSKSKVSQTVSELEKRGLLYRERQGRTYRVYPTEEVQEEV